MLILHSEIVYLAKQHTVLPVTYHMSNILGLRVQVRKSNFLVGSFAVFKTVY
jgi:hypothetical protein